VQPMLIVVVPNVGWGDWGSYSCFRGAERRT